MCTVDIMRVADEIKELSQYARDFLGCAIRDCLTTVDGAVEMERTELIGPASMGLRHTLEKIGL